MKWTEAIKQGEIAQRNFTEMVKIEVNNGLIFVPVNIDGKDYRFLFDSGAPLSISEQLQDEFNFKVISEGTIKDSDHNRKAVNWVTVKTLSLGDIDFENQSAFVGDFQANPILKCLEIDGIIGSNILRQCNWTLDQEQMTLTFTDEKADYDKEDSVVIPFRTDNQFNMFINLNIGRASIKNVLVDYGSNGAVQLNNSVFNTLKENSIVENTLSEIGFQQGGIVGKAVKSDREFTLTDSLKFNEKYLQDVYVRSGKTVSIGNRLLSRFTVTINWDDRKLYLTQQNTAMEPFETAGFKLGYSEERGIYVQSVVENSNAYNIGVRPLMKVLKLNNMDFENGANYCDYIAYESSEELYLEVLNTHGEKQLLKFRKTQIKD